MRLLTPEFGLLGWTLITLLLLLLPVLALVHLARSRHDKRGRKLFWVVVILFPPVFGPLDYFLIGPRQRQKTNQP